MREFVLKNYHKYIKKDNVYKHYELYSKSQYWSKDRLKQFQLGEFQKLWAHAVANVPYYQELSKNIGLDGNGIQSLMDLERIPILTKDIVREEFERLKAKNVDERRFLKRSTSGSTGSNFHFFYDSAQSAIYRALEIRKYKMMGVSIYDRELIVWGTAFEGVKKQDTLLDALRKRLKGKRVMSGYKLSDEGIRNIFEEMIRLQPAVIKSYPSILMIICGYFKKNNLKYQPKVIHIGGEKLYDFQRKEIEATFGCPVYDYYAARDMKQVAMNCGEGNGLHVFMENVIFEVVDENDVPIEEGEGDIILTDLHNYAMPFIRYRIGDRAKISKERKCDCGRGLQIVDEILGRSFEIIEFPNGNKVGGTFWTLVMKSVPGIKDFQVIQQDTFHIQVNYIPDPYYFPIDLNKIVEHIHTYSGEKLKVEFHQVDKIQVTKAGKMQFVISKMK